MTSYATNDSIAYGVSDVHLPHTSVADAFQQAAASGFDLLEFFCPDFARTAPAEYARLGAAYGVRVAYHPPYTGAYDLALLPEEVASRQLGAIIADAQAMTARHIVLHPGSYRDRATSLAQLVRLFTHYAPLCADAGILLGVENFVRCYDEYALGDTVADMTTILAQVPSAAVGMTLDYGHGNVNGNTLELLHTLGPRLVSVHVADNDSSSDSHVTVGAGTVDWPSVLHATAATGFTGPYVMECADPVRALGVVRGILAS